MAYKQYHLIFLLAILVALLSGAVLVGCDVVVPESNSDVEVCNYDDEEYQVKLYQADTGIMLDEFGLEEAWEFDDICDEFKDLFAGSYYITIHEDDEEEVTDRSENFSVDGQEDISFIIDSSGDIEED